MYRVLLLVSLVVGTLYPSTASATLLGDPVFADLHIGRSLNLLDPNRQPGGRISTHVRPTVPAIVSDGPTPEFMIDPSMLHRNDVPGLGGSIDISSAGTIWLELTNLTNQPLRLGVTGVIEIFILGLHWVDDPQQRIVGVENLGGELLTDLRIIGVPRFHPRFNANNLGMVFEGLTLAPGETRTFHADLVTAAPEPGTIALFGIGLLGMGAGAARRRLRSARDE